MNKNMTAVIASVFILMAILSFVAIRRMDRRSTISDLDTMKDLTVSLTISAAVAYAINAYGNMTVGGLAGGVLVTIAAVIFLYREDAKKMALGKAGKT